MSEQNHRGLNLPVAKENYYLIQESETHDGSICLAHTQPSAIHSMWRRSDFVKFQTEPHMVGFRIHLPRIKPETSRLELSHRISGSYKEWEFFVVKWPNCRLQNITNTIPGSVNILSSDPSTPPKSCWRPVFYFSGVQHGLSLVSALESVTGFLEFSLAPAKYPLYIWTYVVDLRAEGH